MMVRMVGFEMGGQLSQRCGQPALMEETGLVDAGEVEGGTKGDPSESCPQQGLPFLLAAAPSGMCCQSSPPVRVSTNW